MAERQNGCKSTPRRRSSNHEWRQSECFRERAEIVDPDLEFRSFAVQRKARLTRIPAIVEQDLKAGIRDKGPNPFTSAMPRRAPETSATQGHRLPST